MPQSSKSPIIASVIRGEIVESVHTIHAVETDADGQVAACAGNSSLVTTLRSSAKPLQAIPALTHPDAAALGMTEEEVAICCASHPGQPRHTAFVASVLALSGFIPDNLVCGGVGYPPSPLRHGCSGNHAAILLYAHLAGFPLDGYERIEHPAQQEIRRVICELSGVTEADVATDGCGVPTFGFALSAMARSFANLTLPGAPWERIPRAMAAHPDLVGSPGWIDVLLMQVTDGRLIAKTGAEGLVCIGMPGQGRGAAIKVLDGSTRALGTATIEWLRSRDWITNEEANDERLSELRRPVFTDPAGNEVGRIVVTA